MNICPWVVITVTGKRIFIIINLWALSGIQFKTCQFFINQNGFVHNRVQQCDGFIFHFQVHRVDDECIPLFIGSIAKPTVHIAYSCEIPRNKIRISPYSFIIVLHYNSSISYNEIYSASVKFIFAVPLQLVLLKSCLGLVALCFYVLSSVSVTGGLALC